MTETKVGRIKEVEIRKVWRHEAFDFTPWLADNLDVLGEELGLDLVLDRTEAAVGRYSLDILAKDANRDAIVVIENQIEETDHSHLGQLLTYAAGTKAKTVIWIATEFREEHRAALDWLNEGTGDSLHFFGIEVRAVKIGDSIPAPLFRLAAVPNMWTKGLKSAPSDLTEKQQQYLEYWRPLLEELKYGRGWRIKTDNALSYYNAGSGLGTGFGRFGRTMRFTESGEARVELWFQDSSRDWNKTAFDILLESKNAIEREFGALVWERLDHAKGSREAVTRKASIGDSETELAETREWMIENLTNFRNKFRPFLTAVLDGVKEKEQEQG